MQEVWLVAFGTCAFVTAWMTLLVKLGEPQSVWLLCDMAGLC
jgi:hypothetical protein